MYNRYVPNAQGSFDRQRAGAPRTESKPAPQASVVSQPAPPAAKQQEQCRTVPTAKPAGKLPLGLKLPDRLDTGDLLVLLILLLLLQENDEDPLPLLITLAAFFLLQ